MATDIERLVVQLSADVTKYQNALNKAMGITNTQTRKIEKRFKDMNKNISSSFANIGKGALAGLFAGVSLSGAKDLIDTSLRIQNALHVTGLEGDKLQAVYAQLFASAQKNAAPIETLVTLYSKAAQVQKELGVSTQDLLKFTDNVALALRVAGTDAQTASGALLQLGQALGSGTVHAEEFNSILEGAPTIAKAAAAGLEEAGGSIATLKQLVITGQVSSQAFFAAFEAGASTLQAQVSGSVTTVSQAFTKLQNSLVDAAGKFNDVSGASREAVELLDRMAGVVSGLSNVFEAAANGPIGAFIGRLSQVNDLIKSVLPGFSALGLLDESKLNAIAGSLGPSAGPSSVPVAGGKGGRVVADPVQSRIDSAFGTDKPTTVSIKDFAPPVGKGSTGKKSKESDYAREIEQIKERTASLQAETAAQAGLNPLVDDYGFAVEKAHAVQELLNAAQKSGVAITPELRASIDALATGYANASVESQKLQESQDELRQSFEDMRDLGKDVFGGFLSDLANGKSASEALASALGKVADKLIEIGLNDLFGKSGSGGLGILGSLFGIGGGSSSFGTPGGFAEMLGIPGYAGGTSNHPGGLAIVGEKGPELLNLPRGSQVMPRVPSIAAGGGGGGNYNDNRTITIDASGAQQGVGEEIKRALKAYDAESVPRTLAALRTARTRGMV